MSIPLCLFGAKGLVWPDIFLSKVAGIILLSIAFNLATFKVLNKASTALHTSLLEATMHAPLSFFDTTPLASVLLTVVVPVMASLVKTVSCLQPTWQPPVVGEDGCLGGGLKPLQLTFATGEDNLDSKEANENG